MPSFGGIGFGGSNIVWATASGGTETTIVDSVDGKNYKVHSFLSGTSNLIVSKAGWSEILLVGGGGGGATADKANGTAMGGGGQVIEQRFWLEQDTYSITVGNGGYPTSSMPSGGPNSGVAGGASYILKNGTSTSRTTASQTSPKYLSAAGGGGGTGYGTPNANNGTGGVGGDGYPTTTYGVYSSGAGGGGQGSPAVGVTSRLRTGSNVIYGAADSQISNSGNGGGGGGFGSISFGSSSGIVVVRYQL